jgi:hypothetical protein
MPSMPKFSSNDFEICWSSTLEFYLNFSKVPYVPLMLSCGNESLSNSSMSFYNWLNELVNY